MTNPVLESLYARKSVRVFTDDPILPEEREAILRAASEAPTAGNQMLYTILEITDQALKETLAESCDHQPFIAKAKLVLIFLADYQRWYDTYQAAGCHPRKPALGELLLSCADAVIAAQNAVTAAESLGIGSCYIGDVMESCERHRELLHLPDYVFPAAMVVFGRPTEQQKQRHKPNRFDLSYIVHQNQYHRLDQDELRTMFRRQEEEGLNRPGWEFEKSLQAFCQRKYHSDFSREMSRSASVYLESWTAPSDK